MKRVAPHAPFWIYRHRRLTRITHWGFATAFFLAAATGAFIFFHARSLPVDPKSTHLAVAYAMLGIAVLYAFDACFRRGFLRLRLTRSDVAKLPAAVNSALRFRHEAAPGGAYNPLQKAAYVAVVLILVPLLGITGLAMWPHAAFAHPIAAFFGGRTVRWWHIGSAVALLGFVAGHVVMVATTGFRNNVRSMLSGWYDVAPAESDRTAGSGMLRWRASFRLAARPATPK